MDMIFATCLKPQECILNIAYNQQIPLCNKTNNDNDQKSCRDPQNLCTADPNFEFSFEPSQSVRDRKIKTSLHHKKNKLFSFCFFVVDFFKHSYQ